METNGDSDEIRDAALRDLRAAEDASDAVRDLPWPVWLYPFNALLLGGIALTPILQGGNRSIVLLALSLVLILVNMSVGYRMGTPTAIPTSQGFRNGFTVATVAVGLSLLLASFGPPGWVFLICACVAVVSFGLGSMAHMRSVNR